MSAKTATLRVAVLDDDSGFVHVLTKRLEGAGCQYRVLSGPVPAEELAAMKLNALVVDPTILGPLAWDFIERVCGMLPDLGVIVCTQGATLAQRVRGLRLGADDWVAKPCHPEEVMARIEAVVRRHRRGRAREDTGPLVAGDLEIRPDRFQVYVARDSLDLTRREFELLQVLADHAGKVLERDDIYRRGWGGAVIHSDRPGGGVVGQPRSKIHRRPPRRGYNPTPLAHRHPLPPPPPEGGP